MRTLAIGDIHGCLRSLEALADYADFSADDTIVTLGDYVDRGPDSKGVIDFLIDLGKSHKLVCLKGNHEIMMQWARKDAEELRLTIRTGWAVPRARMNRSTRMTVAVVEEIVKVTK